MWKGGYIMEYFAMEFFELFFSIAVLIYVALDYVWSRTVSEKIKDLSNEIEQMKKAHVALANMTFAFIANSSDNQED